MSIRALAFFSKTFLAMVSPKPAAPYLAEVYSAERLNEAERKLELMVCPSCEEVASFDEDTAADGVTPRKTCRNCGACWTYTTDGQLLSYAGHRPMLHERYLARLEAQDRQRIAAIELEQMARRQHAA